MNISVTDFMKAATSTAQHFGFLPIEKVRKNKECKNCKDKISHNATASDRRNDSLHGMLTAGMGAYFDNKLHALEGPVLFYSTDHVPRSGEAAISLQIFNVEKSIAEVLLIQTIRAMLAEVGQEDYSIRVNSLGDKDSVTRYVRELTNYLRKRLDDMPAPARELTKEHVLVSLMHLIEKDHELAHRSPSPLEYLSDTSRKHFREIVEYLDISNAPYEIDPKLIGHHECYSETLFAFDVNGKQDTEGIDPVYIRGGRYDTFVSRMSKKHVPASGAVIVLRDKKALTRTPRPRMRKRPAVYMVQLGFGPKVRSLLLMSELKRAKIPILQNIVSDSLSEQLRHAESENVRFAVILGQKEYIENSVIVRDLAAQSQETIPVDRLTSHLKRAVR
jgi:histidyl-tRNA synthetase